MNKPLKTIVVLFLPFLTSACAGYIVRITTTEFQVATLDEKTRKQRVGDLEITVHGRSNGPKAWCKRKGDGFFIFRDAGAEAFEITYSNKGNYVIPLSGIRYQLSVNGKQYERFNPSYVNIALANDCTEILEVSLKTPIFGPSGELLPGKEIRGYVVFPVDPDKVMGPFAINFYQLPAKFGQDGRVTKVANASFSGSTKIEKVEHTDPVANFLRTLPTNTK